jgi:hypothetical protein
VSCIPFGFFADVDENGLLLPHRILDSVQLVFRVFGRLTSQET